MNIERLKAILNKRILVMDGAMGTLIKARNLSVEDFGGPAHMGCNEHLNLTRPEVITSIHEAYLLAGADMIETNTFGGTLMVLDKYGLARKARMINRAGVELARQVADRHSSSERPRLVAGAIGPIRTDDSLSAGEEYAVQASVLAEAGADLLILESFTRLQDLKMAVHAVRRMSSDLPYLALVSVGRDGKLVNGISSLAAVEVAVKAGAVGVGINCSWGTQGLLPLLEEMGRMSSGVLLAVKPSDGVPDRSGRWIVTPIGAEAFARWGREALERGVRLIGGCCGTHPDHISALATMLEEVRIGTSRRT